jgi:hypothetical protein
MASLDGVVAGIAYFVFLVTVDVRANLCALQLIPRGPKVNDQASLQWP